MYILLTTFRTGKFSNELSVLCHLSYLRPFRYELFLQPFWQAALWACETAWISYVTGIKAAFLFLTHRGRKKKKTSQEKSSKLRSCCGYCKCKQANWIMIKYGAIDRSSVWANISRLYLRLDMVSELLASISLPKQTCKGACWPPRRLAVTSQMWDGEFSTNSNQRAAGERQRQCRLRAIPVKPKA